MSTTARERAEDLERGAAELRAVADKYPDATMREIIGGARVARAKIGDAENRVDAVAGKDGRVYFLLYVMVGPVRVYDSGPMIGSDASSVLQAMRDQPDAHSALVEAVRKTRF